MIYPPKLVPNLFLDDVLLLLILLLYLDLPPILSSEEGVTLMSKADIAVEGLVAVLSSSTVFLHNFTGELFWDAELVYC